MSAELKKPEEVKAQPIFDIIYKHDLKIEVLELEKILDSKFHSIDLKFNELKDWCKEKFHGVELELKSLKIHMWVSHICFGGVFGALWYIITKLIEMK